MVTLLGGALLAVVALAFTWPESRRGESVSAGPASAAAGESRVQLAQRIRRAPTDEEKPAEAPTETMSALIKASREVAVMMPPLVRTTLR